MTSYTYAQLEQLWINNGGSSATAPVAAAIAEAESAGNSAATSSNPDGGTNVGLWQLDTPGGGGAGFTQAQLLDANTNAAAAVKASSAGANWGTWETFTSGAYKAFMSGGTTPDPNVPASAAGTAATATLTAATTAMCVLMVPTIDLKITSVGGGCLIAKSQARALIGGMLMLAGGSILAIGVLIVAASAFESSGAGRAVTQAAGAIPGVGGAAARVVSSARPGRGQA